MLTELQDTPVSADRVRAMLQEMVRRGVARMIARQGSDTPVSDPDVHLRQIGAEGAQIREAQRATDWSVGSTFAGEVARQNGMEAGDIAAPAVARQILALMRQLRDLSLRVEKDCDDPLHAGRDLLLNHDIAPTREALKPPLRLSEAIEKACAEAPPDVEAKIRVIGKLALVFFGDIPASSIVQEQSFDFLHMVWMLPKGWGKAHGRNRHGQAGKDLCPLDEIREADAQDARLVAEITSLDTL